MPKPGTAATQSTQPTSIIDNLLDTEETEIKEVDFHDLYWKYANEQEVGMRETAAACLHEGFKLSNE